MLCVFKSQVVGSEEVSGVRTASFDVGDIRDALTKLHRKLDDAGEEVVELLAVGDPTYVKMP